MSIWDAEQLDQHKDGLSKLKPSYINITDATFKSILTLPSPNGDLQNIIVLSTTLKNRYLLQFSSQKLLQEWSSALRLSQFEYSSLQEAYTGGLLSAKGRQLNGIRTLLAETRFAHEDWVSVRFGPGMPWKRCWTIVAPVDPKVKSKAKKKGFEAYGTVSFYEDKKKIKKPPLAKITIAQSAYAIYPSSAVLVNNSTLFKIDGTVTFDDVEGAKDASVFLMPEQHAGVLGFETLIRFLVPVFDAFKLYGRPVRLNADKADLRSLLFGMPTLPKVHYLELADILMLVGVSGSEAWTPAMWTKNIKEILSRKMSTGYKGSGGLTRRVTSMSSLGSGGNSPSLAIPPNLFGKDRSVSQPNSPAVSREHLREPPRRELPQRDLSKAYDSGMHASSSGSGHPLPKAPASNLQVPRTHERHVSDGAKPNTLLPSIGKASDPKSPQLPYPVSGAFMDEDSYGRAVDSPNSSTNNLNHKGSRADIREAIFGNRDPRDNAAEDMSKLSVNNGPQGPIYNHPNGSSSSGISDRSRGPQAPQVNNNGPQAPPHGGFVQKRPVQGGPQGPQGGPQGGPPAQAQGPGAQFARSQPQRPVQQGPPPGQGGYGAPQGGAHGQGNPGRNYAPNMPAAQGQRSTSPYAQAGGRSASPYGAPQMPGAQQGRPVSPQMPAVQPQRSNSPGYRGPPGGGPPNGYAQGPPQGGQPPQGRPQGPPHGQNRPPQGQGLQGPPQGHNGHYQPPSFQQGPPQPPQHKQGPPGGHYQQQQQQQHYGGPQGGPHGGPPQGPPGIHRPQPRQGVPQGGPQGGPPPHMQGPRGQGPPQGGPQGGPPGQQRPPPGPNQPHYRSMVI